MARACLREHDPEFYGTLIRAYERRGRPEDRREAGLVAEYALQFHPRVSDLLWFALCGQIEAENWPLARVRAGQYVEQAPEDLRGWYFAFQSAMRLGLSAEAAAYRERAAALDPDHPLVVRMRVELPEASR